MLDINRKEIPVGSVVYYIQKRGPKWCVDFGVVEEHYSRVIAIELYRIFDRRLINGIPAKDFVTPTEWKKLPKGWSYDTKLFEETWIPMPEIYQEFDFKNPDSILKMINAGVFVKVQDVDCAEIRAEIDKHEGWRIIRRCPLYKSFPITFETLYYKDVYKSFDEALKVVQEHEAELERQANLSDLEWSIELIDKEINRWAEMYSISDKEKSEKRQKIMDLDNLEDVVTRTAGGNLEWKYEGQSRWKCV